MKSMNNDLIELFPEFNMILDLPLKEKVLAVWGEALEIAGWSVADLIKMPSTLLVKDVDITFPQHVRVVCRMCLAVENVLKEYYGNRYNIDHDTLMAGALLADVGKLLEFKKEGDGYVWSGTYQFLRHPFSGVGLCYKHQIPEAVMHIIATHSWEGDNFQRRPEAILFHHADFIDFDLTKYKPLGER
jgi:putative nucleotidyltransferase with HDIG domain